MSLLYQIVNVSLCKVEKFLEPFEIIPFIDLITYTYAEIRTDIENRGEVIEPNDMLIASIVKFHEGILVTNNVREFERVKELKTENWAKPNIECTKFSPGTV